MGRDIGYLNFRQGPIKRSKARPGRHLRRPENDRKSGYPATEIGAQSRCCQSARWPSKGISVARRSAGGRRKVPKLLIRLRGFVRLVCRGIGSMAMPKAQNYAGRAKYASHNFHHGILLTRRRMSSRCCAAACHQPLEYDQSLPTTGRT